MIRSGGLMIALIVLVFLSITLVVAVLSAWSDVRGMTIPNLYSLIILAAFVASYGAAFVLGSPFLFSGLLSHLVAGVVVFVLTLLFFGLGIMGAGDSKLASVLALWLGVGGLVPFLFYTGIFGGIMALLTLCVAKFKPFKSPARGSWIAQVQDGANKVPYGVAIAGGALASFAKLGYFNPELYASFF